jgi:heme oxygenase
MADPASISETAAPIGTEPSLMARLRVATREPHEALHVAPGLSPLLANAPDLSRYRTILERFDAFMEMAETQVLIAADPWFEAQGFPRQSRRPNLARDLEDLDRAGIASAGPPLASNIPTLPKGEGAAMGLLYLSEGSRLGGRTMTRHLAEVLPPEIRSATRFLGTPGIDLSEQWRRFSVFMDAQGRDPTRADDAVQAAMLGFSVLADWFQEAP